MSKRILRVVFFVITAYALALAFFLYETIVDGLSSQTLPIPASKWPAVDAKVNCGTVAGDWRSGGNRPLEISTMDFQQVIVACLNTKVSQHQVASFRVHTPPDCIGNCDGGQSVLAFYYSNNGFEMRRTSVVSQNLYRDRHKCVSHLESTTAFEATCGGSTYTIVPAAPQ